MSNAPSSVRVSAEYGGGDTYWDIYFQPGQLAYAEVADNERRHISVFIDPESGEVSLNNGYEPGSSPYNDENKLFSNFEDSIVDALDNEVPERPEYAAFFRRARADADPRRERLDKLGDAFAEQGFDF